MQRMANCINVLPSYSHILNSEIRLTAVKQYHSVFFCFCMWVLSAEISQMFLRRVHIQCVLMSFILDLKRRYIRLTFHFFDVRAKP